MADNLLIVNGGLATVNGSLATDAGGAPCCCGQGGGDCDYNTRPVCFHNAGSSPFVCCGSVYRFTMEGSISVRTQSGSGTVSGSAELIITAAGAGQPEMSVQVVSYQQTRSVNGSVVPFYQPSPDELRSAGPYCNWDPHDATAAFQSIFDPSASGTLVFPFDTWDLFDHLFCPLDGVNQRGGIYDGACSGACVGVAGTGDDGFTAAWNASSTGFGGTLSMVQTYRDSGGSGVFSDFRTSIDWTITPITPCLIYDCDQPDGSVLFGHGACCFPNGNCQLLTREECRRRGGTYSGDQIRCADAHCPPPPPPPTGICCGPSGCLGRMTQVECVMQSGQWHPDPADCSLCQLPPPIRPCCFPDGSCTMLTGADCNAAGGTWQMNGTTCEAAGCQPQGGACCYAALDSHGQLVWVCIDGPTVSQASCDALAVNAPSNFYPGLTCDQIICPIQPGRATNHMLGIGTASGHGPGGLL